MKERAYIMEGKIQIKGICDKGTTVTLDIPLDRNGKPQ
jgi:nitrate/nitrite-specific signal transduction histidine kinase